METLSIQAVANQTFQVTLNDQDCSIRLYTRNLPDGAEPLYMDLYVSDVAIFYGVICRDGVVLPLYDYLDFEGGLLFVDLQGSTDPQYEGLGDRYRLLYLTADEVEAYNNGTLAEFNAG